MLTFIIFILILSVLVLIHEFGHFYFAKRSGVRVEEFGFGIPPRVIGKRVGETIYSINLLPFGGFVKLTGEDEAETPDQLKKARKDPRNFMAKTPLQRTSIIVAGVMMNILLALVLYYVFFMFTGFQSRPMPDFFDYDFRFGNEIEYSTTIAGFTDGSPASEANINPGEAILTIDGQEVSNVEEVRNQLVGKAGQSVELSLLDLRSTDEQIRTVEVVPTLSEADGSAVLGVYLSNSAILDYSGHKIISGPLHAYNTFAYTIFSFSELIKTSVDRGDIAPVSESVSGPVGIFSIVGGILDYGSTISDTGLRIRTIFLSILDLTALLSITLAFINILPFPALDGGRLLFIVIERVRGKPLAPKYEIMFHRIGMILLLSLLVIVTIRDISRLF